MASFTVQNCAINELNGSCEIDTTTNTCSSYTSAGGTTDNSPTNLGSGSTLKFRVGFSVGAGRQYVITATGGASGYSGNAKSENDDSQVEVTWAATSVTVAAKGSS